MSGANTKPARRFPVSRYVIDFLLALVMSASLGCIICGGFHVAASMQYNIFSMILIPLVYLVVLFVASTNRIAHVIGGVVVVVGTVAAIAALSTTVSGLPTVMADVEGNPCVYLLVTAITTVIIYLLSRTFPGSVALFVLGSLVAAIIQFLYSWNYVILTIVFIVAAVTMVVLKYYGAAYRKADAKDAPRYVAAFAAGLVTSIVVVAVGCGLWFGIDALFHPQALTLKPFKEYFAFEQVPVTGIADDTNVKNEDKTTSNTNDETTYEGGDKVDKDKEEKDSNVQQERVESGAPTEGSIIGYTQDAVEESFQVITYATDDWQMRPWMWVLLVLLILIVLASPFVIKKMLRWRWYSGVLRGSPESQVCNLYLFFLDRFGRIGLGKPAAATALSFGAHNDEGVRLFEANSNTSFNELSQIYTACAYGGVPADEDAVAKFQRFYQTFYKSCHTHVGKVKYLFKFFRL